MRAALWIALLPLLTATGCIVAKDTSFLVEEDIDRIVIAFENGDVEVAGHGDEGPVEVDLEGGGLGFGSVGYDVRDGVLFIDGDCDGISLCGGDLRIRTPSQVSLEVDLNAGDLEILDLDGEVFAGLGAGDLSAEGLGSVELVALVGAGDAGVELREDFDAAWIEVGVGNIDLEVPEGSYRVTSDAGAGSIELVDVIDDPDARARIDVYAGAGEISVIGR